MNYTRRERERLVLIWKAHETQIRSSWNNSDRTSIGEEGRTTAATAKSNMLDNIKMNEECKK